MIFNFYRSGWGRRRRGEERQHCIVTTIKVSKGDEVRMVTSDAESDGEANIVTFNPATRRKDF